jgi:hypothetical protein
MAAIRIDATPRRSPVSQIATDALGKIFEFLSPSDCALAKEVCTGWYRLISRKGVTPLLHAADFATTAPLLDWAWARGWRPSLDGLGRLAEQVGARVRPPVLQWLLDHGMQPRTEMIATIDRVQTLEWFKGRFPERIQCYVLRAHGMVLWRHNLEAIKWYYRNGRRLTMEDLKAAALSNNAGKFIWAMHHAAARALNKQNVDFIYALLLQNKIPRSIRICMELLERKCAPPQSCWLAVDAAYTEQYEVLREICERGLPIHQNDCMRHLRTNREIARLRFAPAGPAELRIIDEMIDLLSTRQDYCDIIAHHPDCTWNDRGASPMISPMMQVSCVL